MIQHAQVPLVFLDAVKQFTRADARDAVATHFKCYPDAMRQGNVVRVLQSLYRRFAPYNNSLEHTAKISARLRLSSIFSGAQLAPRYALKPKSRGRKNVF